MVNNINFCHIQDPRSRGLTLATLNYVPDVCRCQTNSLLNSIYTKSHLRKKDFQIPKDGLCKLDNTFLNEGNSNISQRLKREQQFHLRSSRMGKGKLFDLVSLHS